MIWMLEERVAWSPLVIFLRSQTSIVAQVIHVTPQLGIIFSNYVKLISYIFVSHKPAFQLTPFPHITYIAFHSKYCRLP